MNRKPERNELQILLDHCNLAVGTWAPGDGQKRYRFFPRTDASPHADYHEGDGLYTALGRGEAVTYLRGYRAALNATRAQAMRAALQVLTLGSRAWLLANDPKALKQALTALGEDTTEVERHCAGGDLGRNAADYAVENHGSLFLLRPLTDAARQNLEDKTDNEAQWFGGALVVEHRFIESLVAQLRGEAWTVR